MEVEALALSFRSKFIKQFKMRGLEQRREKPQEYKTVLNILNLENIR